MQQKSLGLIETQGLAAGVVAADAAVKSANVELVGYELTKGGGWTVIKVQGDVGAVKAAVDAARVAAGKVNRVVSTHVIARPSSSLEHLIHTADTVGDQQPQPPKGPEPPSDPPSPQQPQPPEEPQPHTELTEEQPEEPQPSPEPVEEPAEEPQPAPEPADQLPEEPEEPESPEETLPAEEAATEPVPEVPPVEQPAVQEEVQPAAAPPAAEAAKAAPTSRRGRKGRNKSSQEK